MDINEMANAVNDVLSMELFKLGEGYVTIGNILGAVLILGATFVISALLRKGLKRGLRLRGVKDEGTVGVVTKLTHYGIMAVGFAVSIQALGLDIGALFAAGAIFAVGIGFAMQNIAQNFVAGLILLVERAIKPGDVLDIEGSIVKVKRMGIRATVARSLDEEEIIVPNYTLVQSAVKNYTLDDSSYRLRVPVGVIYASDMKLVRQILVGVAEGVDWRLKEPSPVVLMTAFGSSSVDFEVSVWISDPWTIRRRSSDLHEAIWWALKEKDVVIAFPQVDVHFDGPVVESLDAMARAS